MGVFIFIQPHVVSEEQTAAGLWLCSDLKWKYDSLTYVVSRWRAAASVFPSAGLTDISNAVEQPSVRSDAEFRVQRERGHLWMFSGVSHKMLIQINDECECPVWWRSAAGSWIRSCAVQLLSRSSSNVTFRRVLLIKFMHQHIVMP